MTALLFNKLSKLIMRQACSLFFDFQRQVVFYGGREVGGGGGGGLAYARRYRLNVGFLVISVLSRYACYNYTRNLTKKQGLFSKVIKNFV